jgi:hypothetical protein
MSITNLTPTQLRQAADLQETIAKLKNELAAILGGETKAVSVAAKPTTTPAKKKGGMSAAGRARIVAAQKLRWAKVKAAKVKTTAVKAAVKAVVAKPAKKKFVRSTAAKANQSAKMKAYWAAKKAAKKA